jgi:NAD-dependent dihydropyrimidine dehydrogenase PreA subunit
MSDLTHGFRIDPARCRGRLACMRACPTEAIRVKEGKAALRPELCIDCGSCLRACPSGAIQATTGAFAEFDKFKYRVAVPSPVLFGQFPVGLSPARIVAGLQSIGFDAVWDFAPELALVNRAIADYVEKWHGPHPLVSVSCPVVVRLVQVSYPNMLEQLVRIQPPRELAGRALKEKYSKQLGVDRGEVAAIYITPCQAKTISILAPAEGAKSYLDGAIGISDVYNGVLAFEGAGARRKTPALAKDPIRSAEVSLVHQPIAGARPLSSSLHVRHRSAEPYPGL